MSFAGGTSAASASDLSKLSPDLVSVLQPHAPKAVRTYVNGKIVTALAAPTAQPSQIRVLVRMASSSADVKSRIATLKSVARHGALFGGRAFPAIGVESVTVTPQQLRAIASNPLVVSISRDRPMKTTQVFGGGTVSGNVTAVPIAVPDVNGPSVGADIAGSQATSSPTLDGTGVTVAVVDSGISPVDDIKNRIVAFEDCVNGQTSPYDDNGHGTHVAGIVAGDGTDSSGVGATRTFKGIAPGAGIVGVKVTDANGNTSASTVISGIEWCIENQATYNIRVMNLSLGGAVVESYKTDPVCQAVEQAVSAGIVVVVSAGNYGGSYGYITSPGNDPSVITVGASNSEQSTDRSIHRITSYTSRGPTIVDRNVKPDLIAPGNKIVSLRVPGSTIDVSDGFAYVDPSEYLSSDYSSSATTSYTRLSGTSMAAPAVSGAVAIMLEQNASLHPNGVKLALMYSAQSLRGYDPVLKATVTYDPFTEGAGELNIPGATQLASLMAPSGLTAAPAMSSTIGGASFKWFAATAADHLVVSGSTTDTFWGNPNVWSSSVLWSAQNLTWGGDENLTWGGDENLTWGGDENLTWGGDENLTWGGDETLAASMLSGQNLTWGGDENLTWGGDENLTWGGDENLTWGGDENLTWGGDENLTWGGDENLTWGGDETLTDSQAVITGD